MTYWKHALEMCISPQFFEPCSHTCSNLATFNFVDTCKNSHTLFAPKKSRLSFREYQFSITLVIHTNPVSRGATLALPLPGIAREGPVLLAQWRPRSLVLLFLIPLWCRRRTTCVEMSMMWQPHYTDHRDLLSYVTLVVREFGTSFVVNLVC